jgi:hypothetical protein
MRPEHWLFTIPLRLRSLIRRAQADQELDEELRDHLERAAEKYVAQGMTPEKALRRARLELGGIEQTKEKCRDARGVNWIHDFVGDLRHGLRGLRKNLGVTTIVVLTLALGVGANTAIFGLVNGILLQRLPVSQPEQIVALVIQSSGSALGALGFSYPQLVEFRQQTEVGVDWENVLPAWFKVLSATAGPSEYAQGITTVLRRHYKHGRTKMFAVARKIATPAQRQALPERECASSS